MTDTSADDAELAAQSNQFQGWYEGYHGRDDEVAALRAEIDRLRAALRPFAAHFQFSAGYNNHDFQVASEAYGHVIADEQIGIKEKES